jgi:Flp pilus assembly protein TadD
VGSDRWFRAIGAPRETGVGVVWWNTPSGAAAFIETARPSGPVFNAIRDGGFLAWRLRDGRGEGVRVFSDGRLEVYGPEFVGRLALLGPAAWPAFEAAHRFNTLVVPVAGNEGLVNAIASDRRAWSLVHADHRNVVFVRVMPEHAELIARHRLRLGVPWQGAMADESAPGWKRAIGGVSRPWFSAGMGETMLALGAVDRAKEFFALALERFPGHQRSLAMLAALERFGGAAAAGDALASRLTTPAWRIASDEELLRLLVATGRFGEALAPARRLAGAEPTARARRLALGDVAHQAGEHGVARDAYIAAAEMQEADAELWAKIGYSLEHTEAPQQAVNAYSQSLSMDPTQVAIWSQLGGLLEKLGDRAGAVSAYRRALELRPDASKARAGLERLAPPEPR